MLQVGGTICIMIQAVRRFIDTERPRPVPVCSRATVQPYKAIRSGASITIERDFIADVPTGNVSLGPWQKGASGDVAVCVEGVYVATNRVRVAMSMIIEVTVACIVKPGFNLGPTIVSLLLSMSVGAEPNGIGGVRNSSKRWPSGQPVYCRSIVGLDVLKRTWLYVNIIPVRICKKPGARFWVCRLYGRGRPSSLLPIRSHKRDVGVKERIAIQIVAGNAIGICQVPSP